MSTQITSMGLVIDKLNIGGNFARILYDTPSKNVIINKTQQVKNIKKRNSKLLYRLYANKAFLDFKYKAFERPCLASFINMDE